MARRTSTYQINDAGRDQGKRFLITEMPASQAESWAYRVLLALAGSNAEIPDASTGMAGLAQIGLRGLAGLPWPVAEPLLREMLQCVQVLPDPKNPTFARSLEGEGDYDIEEIITRMKLRVEVFKLHMDFLSAALQSLSDKVGVAVAK